MTLRSIQFLRAVAALLVVYAHSIDLQKIHAPSFQQHFYSLENFGAFGVDIFFVISGFIICFSGAKYEGGRAGLVFLRKRFIRVNPVYYVVTLFYVSLFLIHGMSLQSAGVTTASIYKSIWLLPLQDRTGWIETILPIAATLSFEWWFYILFSLTVILRTRHKEYWLAGLIGLPVLAGFLLHAVDYRLHFISNPILGEFLLGVLIYWCYRNLRAPKWLAALFLFTGAGICLGEIILGYGDISEMNNILTNLLSGARFVRWGIPAGLLVAGCVFLEKGGSLKAIWENPLTSLAGDASYSIYLIHLIVFGLFSSLYVRLGFFMHPDLAVWVQLAAGALGGILFYKVVEAPFLSALHGRRRR